MVDQAILNIFIPLFVFGALVVFLAFGAATVVLMIHLTGMPESRRQTEAGAAASFAD